MNDRTQDQEGEPPRGQRGGARGGAVSWRGNGRPVEARAPAVMMGIPFDNVTSDEVIGLVDAMISSGHPHFLATANADFLRLARSDAGLRRALREADLVVCDGTPLVWMSRWLGAPLPERVAGSELVPRLLARAEKKGYRVFFLGGREEVLEAARTSILARWPELEIAGMYSPPFAPLEAMDHQDLVDRIVQSRADMVLVSFGCPKQEKWLVRHIASTGAAVGIGMGATIDFLAGRTRQAPPLLRVAGVEWIWRTVQEPRRMLKRYAADLCVVVPGLLRQWGACQVARARRNCSRFFGLLHGREARKPLAPAAAGSPVSSVLPSFLDASLELPLSREGCLPGHRSVVLDATATVCWNAAGLGRLLRHAEAVRIRGGRCEIIQARRGFRKALQDLNMSGECVHLVPDSELHARLTQAIDETQPMRGLVKQREEGT